MSGSYTECPAMAGPTPGLGIDQLPATRRVWPVQ